MMGGGIAQEITLRVSKEGATDSGVAHRGKAAPAGATQEIDGNGFEKVVLVMSGVDGGVMLSGSGFQEAIASLTGAFFGGVGTERLFGRTEKLVVLGSQHGDEALIVVGTGASTVVKMSNDDPGVVAVLVKQDDGVDAARNGE